MYKVLPIILLPFICCLQLSAQTSADTVQRIAEKLNNYAITHVAEKVHLHTDRDRYAIGDTIWFKAYIGMFAVKEPFFTSLPVG